MTGILYLLFSISLVSFTTPAWAERASLVVDLGSGAVLHADNARLKSFPASLTKLMTLYLIFEAIESNQIKLRDSWTVSAKAQQQKPVKLGLRAGWSIMVEEVLLALIIHSANDAALVAAESLADGETAFAEMMNAKAKRLGMIDSLFRNASGLPDSEQVSTARDMALLAQALRRDFPQHFHLFSRRSFQYRGRTFKTHNDFLSEYTGAKGMKTGFTCNAGYNLVSFIERDGQRLIGVILGERNAKRRNARMTKLFNEALARKIGEKTPLSLTRLLNASGRGTQKPPNRGFIADVCIKTAEVRFGDVSGWSLTVGAKKKANQARALAAKRIRTYRRQLKGGRPLVIPTLLDGLQYRAVVTGLKRDKALAACRYLQEKKQYCMVMPTAVGRMNVKRGRIALKRK